jgi:hypothetical protein
VKDLEEKFYEYDCDGYLETDEEIAKTNELARLFYYAHGYQIEEGYNFEDATHPQERLMFRLAMVAFNYVRSQS